MTIKGTQMIFFFNKCEHKDEDLKIINKANLTANGNQEKKTKRNN